MASRYSKRTFIQPIRTISRANTDITYIFKQFDNIDTLADHYYHDVTLGWIIMCANPIYFNEFQIPKNVQLRIPMPLERVWPYLGLDGTDAQ